MHNRVMSPAAPRRNSHAAAHHPGGESLWAATAPPAAPLAVLAADLRADVAIVGAGFTGLSAAIHLAEAGVDAVVLEAKEPGFGASGRNGGQVIPGLKYDPDELEKRYGPEMGPQVVRTAARGPDVVFDLIGRYRIDCASLRTGWIQPAHTAAARALLHSRVAQWQRRAASVRELSGAEVAALTGTTRYVGGWLDLRGGTVQPLAYVRGLVRAALGLGVRVYADAPVAALHPDGDGWRLQVGVHTVRARRVLLATNAYSGRLHDALRRSVVAVPSFQIATSPLTADQRARILVGGQGVSDTFNLLRYYRLDPAGRLVLGARGLYGQRSVAESIRAHDAALRDLYPELGEPSYDYRWSGYVAVTADHVPHLHELAPGLHAALGYNGRGVAMATMLGRIAASALRGICDPEFAFPATTLKPLRLHRFSRLGVRLAVGYLRLLDQRSADREPPA